MTDRARPPRVESVMLERRLIVAVVVVFAFALGIAAAARPLRVAWHARGLASRDDARRRAAAWALVGVGGADAALAVRGADDPALRRPLYELTDDARERLELAVAEIAAGARADLRLQNPAARGARGEVAFDYRALAVPEAYDALRFELVGDGARPVLLGARVEVGLADARERSAVTGRQIAFVAVAEDAPEGEHALVVVVTLFANGRAVELAPDLAARLRIPSGSVRIAAR